jgi:Protein of unknown function (DUF1571)
MNAVRTTLRASTTFLFGVLLLGVGVLAQVQAQGPGKGVVPAAANAEQLSFEQPLNWMYEAKTNYAAVKDYTCTLVSQEKVNGKMGDQSIVTMKFMAPFSVHMKWLAPQKDVGQEVVFVQGKNNNKMRVNSKRLPGLGFFSIDVTDPRVLQNSRHTILEAGIGNMIDQTIKAWEIERSIGKTKVLPPVPAKYNQRDCIKVEVVRLEKNAQLFCYRTVIYLEKVSKMPIRLENYDWPRQGGAAEGELLEMFSYVNIQFNTGLKDAEFNK